MTTLTRRLRERAPIDQNQIDEYTAAMVRAGYSLADALVHLDYWLEKDCQIDVVVPAQAPLLWRRLISGVMKDVFVEKWYSNGNYTPRGLWYVWEITVGPPNDRYIRRITLYDIFENTEYVFKSDNPFTRLDPEDPLKRNSSL